MHRLSPVVAALVLASLAGASRGDAQQAPAADTIAAAALVGRIVTPWGAPISGVNVSFEESPLSAVTDSLGRFALRAPPLGWYVVTARRPGFQAASFDVEVVAGATTRVTYAMLPIASVLDAVRVRGRAARPSLRMAEFEHRRRTRTGTFITRDVIERRDVSAVSDLLRGVLSIQVADSAGIPRVISRRGMRVESRGGLPQPVPCPLRIALDGMLLPPDATVDVVPARDVEGIEVYSGPATTPREYSQGGRDANCGLVVIWTRGGAPAR